MAMLAEPRRKQKVINLRAKNNAWSNDTNKFGQKMLEKMGWSAGKGLGAKENGIVEHVVAKYKNDEKGLGFEDKNDQWTKHEDDFNALLANLSNAETNSEKLHSGISLEKKSKKSKARIHYHKFTRGKDLSRYSEKELANIFGKKSFKESKAEELVEDDIKTSAQVFTEKGSMSDYFKDKLASLKLKSKFLDSNCKVNEEEDVSNYNFKGFSNDNTNNDFESQPHSFYNVKKEDNIETEIPDNNIENNEEIIIPKKRKKSKKKEPCATTPENLNNSDIFELKINNELENSELQEIKVKKSKKKKYQEFSEEISQSEETKKKKKDKNKVHENALDQSTSCVDQIPKKKKLK